MTSCEFLALFISIVTVVIKTAEFICIDPNDYKHYDYDDDGDDDAEYTDNSGSNVDLLGSRGGIQCPGHVVNGQPVWHLQYNHVTS